MLPSGTKSTFLSGSDSTTCSMFAEVQQMSTSALMAAAVLM